MNQQKWTEPVLASTGSSMLLQGFQIDSPAMTGDPDPCGTPGTGQVQSFDPVSQLDLEAHQSPSQVPATWYRGYQCAYDRRWCSYRSNLS